MGPCITMVSTGDWIDETPMEMQCHFHARTSSVAASTTRLHNGFITRSPSTTLRVGHADASTLRPRSLHVDLLNETTPPAESETFELRISSHTSRTTICAWEKRRGIPADSPRDDSYLVAGGRTYRRLHVCTCSVRSHRPSKVAACDIQ